MLYASTCTCNLILCHNYNSIKEFHECIELCIEYSDFNETEYQRIGSQVNINIANDNSYIETSVNPGVQIESTGTLNNYYFQDKFKYEC